MIELDNVAYSYGGGELLSEISLKLSPGSFHFLTGPSGSGKTTFLKLCYGALVPTAGHARLFGAGSVGQIVIMPLAGADVVALPGHILVVDAGLIAEVDDPAVVAGSLLAGELVAGDPLEPILDAGGFASVVRLLTTSDLPRDVLKLIGTEAYDQILPEEA